MLSISHVTKLPTDRTIEQVRDIAAVSVTDLSLHGITETNRMFELYSWLVQTEIIIYASKIGIEQSPFELILARNWWSRSVIGFVLLSRVDDVAGACGVIYMGVHPKHRRQGIGRRLMRKVVSLYPHAELTCHVPTVAFYEKAGFQIIDSHLTQVAMCTRPESPAGNIQVLDGQQLLDSVPAVELLRQLQARWGVKAMVSARQAVIEQAGRLTQQAEAFVMTRLKK